MLKFFRYVILMWVFFVSVVMAECLDIYGVDAKEGNLILKQYSPDLQKLSSLLSTGMRTRGDEFPGSPEGTQWAEKGRMLKEKIKRDHHYAYVEMETVFYDKKEHCTTLEVIKSNQQDRLRYVQTKQKTSYPKTSDSIDEMGAYLTIGDALFLANEIHETHADCPVYHCTMGFLHPKLKPYLQKFNTTATQERQLIIDTLNHDANPERRAWAAYLVGHFKDPHDIVRVLMPHVNDIDDGVRNNVIRVLSLTIFKAKITDLSPEPFVYLLNSPYLTDRNKSLFLLSTLVESKSTQNYLIRHAKTPLLDILRLQQPNQHSFAYMILKSMSHQDFGPHDEVHWAKWFDDQQRLMSRKS